MKENTDRRRRKKPAPCRIQTHNLHIKMCVLYCSTTGTAVLPVQPRPWSRKMLFFYTRWDLNPLLWRSVLDFWSKASTFLNWTLFLNFFQKREWNDPKNGSALINSTQKWTDCPLVLWSLLKDFFALIHQDNVAYLLKEGVEAQYSGEVLALLK